MTNLSRNRLEKLVDVLADFAFLVGDVDSFINYLSDSGITDAEMQEIGIEV